jgi:hypothetical protein
VIFPPDTIVGVQKFRTSTVGAKFPHPFRSSLNATLGYQNEERMKDQK